MTRTQSAATKRHATGRRMAAWTLGILLSASVWPIAGHAFASIAVGDPLANPEMPKLGGGKQALLDARAGANVVIFFRPQQDHSAEALAALAQVEKELAGSRVHWTAVVSSSWSAAEVEQTVRAAGIKMPVLIDEGDALYGQLGVRLHPVVGVADEKLRLVAYEPFHKINYADRVRGKIRYALHEITLAEVDKIDNPPKALMPNEMEGAVANRHVRMGEVYFGMGEFAKAESEARHVLEGDPRHARAHVLLGDALTKQGRCKEALATYDAAAKIDAKFSAVVKPKRDDCLSRR